MIYIVTVAISVYFLVALVSSLTTGGTAVQSLDDLADVIINSPTNSQVLAFINGAWRNSDINGLINNLPWNKVSKVGSTINDIDNVNANPAIGQVLEWDGTQWVAGNDDTTSLTDNSVSSNHIVDNTIINSDISSTANIAWNKISKVGSTINDIDNVNANPTVGQVLEWDGTQWVAGNDDTTSSSGTTLTMPVSDVTYLIFRNTTGYYARNTATNNIDYSGTDAGAVVTSALNNAGGNTKIAFVPTTSHDIFVFTTPIIIQYDNIEIDCNEATLQANTNNLNIILIDPIDTVAQLIYIHECSFDLNNKPGASAINTVLTSSDRISWIYITQNNFINIASGTTTQLYINLTNEENLISVDSNRFISLDGSNTFGILIDANGVIGSNTRIINNMFSAKSSATASYPIVIRPSSATGNQVGRIAIAFNHYFVFTNSPSSADNPFVLYNGVTGTTNEHNRGIDILYNHLENCNTCIKIIGNGNGGYFNIIGNTFELSQTYNFTTGNNYAIYITNTRSGAKIIDNEFDVRRANYVAIHSESPRPILIAENTYRTREASYASITPYEITVNPDVNFRSSSFIDINTETFIRNTGSISLTKGVINSPFTTSGLASIVPWGTTSTITSGTTYTALFFTYFVSITGGSGVSITIVDANNTTIVSNVATYTGILKPGWKITVTYTTTPTITVVI